MMNLNDKKVPYVVFANKQDIRAEELEFDMMQDVPIIPTLAKYGKGIRQGLELLLELVKMGR